MSLQTRLMRGASIAALLTIALPVAAGVQANGGPNHTGKGGSSQQEMVVKLGSANLGAAAGSNYHGTGSTSASAEIPRYQPNDQVPKSHSNQGGQAGTPNPKGASITTSNPGFTGFDALNHLQQHNAGTGIYSNSQFSLEPPDQGLCTNGSQVMEGVNNAVAVYDTTGKTLMSPTALSKFWGIAPEIDRSNAPNYIYGPFISDPKCYYDVATEHWFLTELEFGVDPSSGAYTGTSAELIAVSQSSDPTGSYNLYSLSLIHI